ncbi:hypothetical protein ACKFKF_10345 [Phormidesmis sp. 146-12]
MSRPKSLYPAWIPYPICWLRAISLAIPTYFGVIVFAAWFWLVFILGSVIVVASLATNSLKPELLLFLFGFSLACLAGGLVWYLALKVMYVIFLKLFWSTPPYWLSPSRKWSELLYSMVITTIATLPVVLVALPYFSSSQYCIQEVESVGFVNSSIAARLGTLTGCGAGRLIKLYTSDLNVELSLRLLGVWLLGAAYLYQLRYLLEKRNSQKKI